MNQLPVGMYQPGDSIVYKLNASVKIIAMLILLVAVIFTDSVAGYCILILFLACLLFVSKINLFTAMASVRRLKWFFLVILLMNTCFFSAEDAWISFCIFVPSYKGLMQGIHVIVCVVFALIISNILTVTTTPLALTEAINTLLSPLQILKIPTGQIAMIMSVAIQFIPTLFGETEMIRKAQTARGARFDSSKLSDKAKAVMPLIIPVFISAFRRADELSMAMEARGYRADLPYSKCRLTRFSIKDLTALLVCILLCGLQIVV